MTTLHGLGKGQMAAAELVRLTDLVNYRDCAVVRRTIVKRETGTITLLRRIASKPASPAESVTPSKMMLTMIPF
jgi:hypothetical protein